MNKKQPEALRLADALDSEPSDITGHKAAAELRRLHADNEALRKTAPQLSDEPVAWLYTLEYGRSIADRRVSLEQLRYPFGVCGADYLRVNDNGMSYVRETPLYYTPNEQS